MPAGDPVTPTLYFGVYVGQEDIQESWKTFGRSTAKLSITVGWQDRIALINNIFSYGGINVAQQPTFGQAAAYPDAPTLLLLDTLDVKKLVPSNNGLTVDPVGLVAGQYARCELLFASYPYDQNNLNVTSVEYGIEDVALDSGSYKWVDTGAVISNVIIPSLRICTSTITITQYNQLSPSQSVINAVLNKVNESTVFGCPAGTLQFQGGKSNRRMQVSGVTNYDITFQFKYLAVGWNKKYRPGSGFVGIVDQSGNPPFPTDTNNFSSLGIFNATGLIGL